MFISVKEAMELTGLSSTTIYRLCNKRINTLYVRREDNKFFIDKEFLLATYPPDFVQSTEDLDNEPDLIQPVDKEIKELPVDLIEPEMFRPVINRSLKNSENEIPEIIKPGDVIEMMVEPLITVADNVSAVTIMSEENQVDEILQKVEKKSIAWEKWLGIAASLIFVALFIYLIYSETINH